MKKILFYPLWKAEDLETKLHEFELSGLRLTSISHSIIFHFTASKPKDVAFIVTYDVAKDNRTDMFEYEQELLSAYSANLIDSIFTDYKVFRITSSNRDFENLKNYRKGYFKYVLFLRLIVSILFLLLSIFLMCSLVIYDISNVFVSALIYIFCFIMAIIFVYNLHGYITQVRK